jgi:hypothetical protein
MCRGPCPLEPWTVVLGNVPAPSPRSSPTARALVVSDPDVQLLARQRTLEYRQHRGTDVEQLHYDIRPDRDLVTHVVVEPVVDGHAHVDSLRDWLTRAARSSCSSS